MAFISPLLWYYNVRVTLSYLSCHIDVTNGSFHFKSKFVSCYMVFNIQPGRLCSPLCHLVRLHCVSIWVYIYLLAIFVLVLISLSVLLVLSGKLFMHLPWAIVASFLLESHWIHLANCVHKYNFNFSFDIDVNTYEIKNFSNIC